MSRGLSSAHISALGAGSYALILLAELDFPSGITRVHSGVGALSWNGQTWLGIGELGKVSPLQETTELQSFGFSLELSGIDSTLVSVALGDNIQGRSANLWVALLDDQHQIIDTPIGPWSGRMDTLSGEMGKTATLTLTVESRLADWERARIRRYTDADQQAQYPGDKGLEFVSQMQEKEIIWGPAPK